MRRLLMDILHLRKWFYVSASFYFIAASTTFNFSSVGLGLGIGAMMSVTLNTREIYYLPVSRKEIWRTRLILAFIPVVLSAFIRPVVVGIRMAVSHTVNDNPGWFLPASAFQLIYIGSLFAASIPLSYYTAKITSPAKRFLAIGALALAAIILGAVIQENLPRQWYDLTGGAIFMLAIGACLSALSFFHEPRILPRRIVPMVNTDEQPGRSSSIRKPDVKAEYMRTGLTSLKLLLWRQIRAVLFVGVLVFLSGSASQLMILIAGRGAPYGSWLEHMTIFSDPIPYGAMYSFMVAIFFAVVWIAMAPDLLGLRGLRALPVTTRTLAAMLTLIPALFWVVFWVFQLATYWILAGHLPSTFRWDLLAGPIALTCLTTSVALQSWVKGPAQFFVLGILAAAAFVIFYIYGTPTSTATPLITVLGLAGIALSFVLINRALQRNGSVYKSKLPPRGLGRPNLIVQ